MWVFVLWVFLYVFVLDVLNVCDLLVFFFSISSSFEYFFWILLFILLLRSFVLFKEYDFKCTDFVLLECFFCLTKILKTLNQLVQMNKLVVNYYNLSVE